MLWYVSTETDYFGTQHWKGLSLDRIETTDGYIKNDTLSAYYRDYQGNICAVIRGGKLIQATNYYPYGMPIAGGTNPDEQRHKYSGKELLTHAGLNCYDFGPRSMNPALALFDNPDLLQEKYYVLHPYLYCAANPIRNIDPSGMTVVALQEDMQDLIKYTLTDVESQYVKFDEAGLLDNSLLNQCESSSENMTALKELSNSTTTYKMYLSESYQKLDDMGNIIEKDLKEKKDEGTIGVCTVPGHPEEPSIDNDVNIYVSSRQGIDGQVSNLAHEAYSHAYFYELKNQGMNINPFHDKQVVDYVYVWDYEFNCAGVIPAFKDINMPLVNQIEITTRQAINNYKKYHSQ